MSVLTRFFNLIKPAKTESVKVSDFNENMDIIDTEMHRPPLTVNGIEPNPESRNLELTTVPLADNLTSDEAQFNSGTYLERTSGGSTPVHDGDAFLSPIKGNQVKTGYVPEEINMSVNAVERQAPPPIEVTIDEATFEAFVEVAGVYTLTYNGTEWSATPSDYGLTITNDPVDGDKIVIDWDGDSSPAVLVDAVPRTVPPAITAQLSVSVWRAYVPASGTYTFTYTSGWSANLALYGITVQNAPVSGDEIVVEYVKLNRGTITTAAVTSFNSTGWNLYDNSTGIARVIKYSDDYGYMVGGNYSVLQYSETESGTGSIVTVENGYFNIPADGFITVIGGDATTYIFPTWTDWVEGYHGAFEAYHCDTITLSGIMTNFPAGLCAIGETRDEINFNIQRAISRIQRIPYTDADLEAIIASGRAYDTDTNYIYVVRETPSEYVFDVPGTYTVSDHGIEFFLSPNNVPVVCETVYGQNLKDKLRMDVLTISQQTLSAAQQAQARTNIGAASQADLTTTNSNLSSLTKTVNGKINTSAIANNVTTTASGYVLDARQGKALNDGLTGVKTGTTGTTTGIRYFRTLNSKLVVVNVGGATINTGANAWKTIGTLPSGYRPSYSFYFAVIDDLHNVPYEGRCNPNGVVEFYGSTAYASAIPTANFSFLIV